MSYRSLNDCFVWIVDREDLRRAFDKFYWSFALSLLPGMVVWFWLVAGLPLEVRWITPPSHIVQRGVIDYFEVPGVVMLPYNAMTLPNGGFMARLCGIYDEPGTVGTIAALCLAVIRFRLRDIRGAISFVAGIMSFSVAFSILTALGFSAMSINSRRPALLGAAALSAMAGAIPLTGLKFHYEAPPVTRIDVIKPAAPVSIEGDEPTIRERFIPNAGLRLRFSEGFDDRAQPGMRRLFEKYLNAPAKSLFFGLASDASIVHGQGSSVWFRLLTDFGIIGFCLGRRALYHPGDAIVRERKLNICIATFCVLFLMSFYQRPIIWLPAQLLIFLAGLSYPVLQSRSHSPLKPKRVPL